MFSINTQHIIRSKNKKAPVGCFFIFGKADRESNVGGSVTLHPILAYGTFSARTLMIFFLL